MTRHPSPAPSTTSCSDNDYDDANKSTFFPAPDLVVTSPAQWSSKLHLIAPTHVSRSRSPISRLPPEVLIHILKHLHSARDLYSSLLVSQTWCECSVELLWHKPSFSSLGTLVKMMRVLTRGDQTFTYARFIRRLNFLFLGVDLTDSLFTRLARCHRLERLTLVNCALISDDALSRVLPCCPNLVAIDLTAVIDTSDRAIIALTSAARRLQGINLANCKKVTDAGVLSLAHNCPLLRRVKLSGVEQLTDESVSGLAKNCPLLLEIDLNRCKQITDASVRDIWVYSTHMREMRLSHCENLTDLAFPAPPSATHDIIPSPARPHPFPPSNGRLPEELPPLVLPRLFDHLRMLDLTGCARITDDVLDGIISCSPKIRNLVLSKCELLTDRTVESICKLGKNLHYLHLGHAELITDRSVRVLARCCTRLRYVDFANCTLLTDMAVFELASLPKLRRIGLVRVSNLTDEAIYALADRDATLERIHLSYCEQITVMAIHFLLQRLPKLTHLSLTGIPAFRKPELQKFCRPPPSEFNTSQRATFCVYSGKGISELRAFLQDCFRQLTQEMHAADDNTEYDDDGFAQDNFDVDLGAGSDGDEGDDDDEDEHYVHISNRALPPQATPANSSWYHGRRHAMTVASGSGSAPQTQEMTNPRHQQTSLNPIPTTDRALSPLPPLQTRVNGTSRGPPTPTRRTVHGRAFGHPPIVETSISPAPSDVASNRSTGTNHSNGAGFFRTYHEAAMSSSARSNGALTPDLDFAEIGHGRGTGQRVADPMLGVAGPSSSMTGLMIPFPGIQSRAPRTEAPSDPSTSYRPITWPQILTEASTPSDSPSPTRQPHDSLPIPNGEGHGQGRDAEGRGRSVKRSLRNISHAAEHLASSFLFGRASGGGGGMRGEPSRSGTAVDGPGRP